MVRWPRAVKQHYGAAHDATGDRVSTPLVVLVRPRNHDNLLSIARTMQQFGLREWVAVIPAEHLTRMRAVAAMKYGEAEARTLDSLRRVDSLSEAVSGCAVVVGTTMRLAPGRPRLTPRELASCQAHTAESWALVFGAETNGLNDDDLKSCNALSFIPADDEQPSVNLAQAVLLYEYELHVAREADAATWVDVAGLQSLRDLTAMWLRRRGLPRRTADELVAPLHRATPTRAEAGVWARALR